MAKQLTKAQISPILKILNLSKQKELETVWDRQEILAEAKAISDQNEADIEKRFGPQMSEINKLTEKLNKEVTQFMKKKGIKVSTHRQVFTPHDISQQICGRTSVKVSEEYHSNEYFTISKDQAASIADTREQKKYQIELKYASIEAQLLLATDFDFVKNLLASFGIELPDAGPTPQDK